MVKQYPHIITITTTGTPAKTGTGYYTVPAGSTVVVNGRAENDGGNAVIGTPAGQTEKYTFVIYMPKQTFVVPYGATIQIEFENGAKFTGYAKNHSNGQLNSRIWV